MPYSPMLSTAEVQRARDKFMKAWSKKWFNPLSWLRQPVIAGVRGPTDMTSVRHVEIHVRNERQALAVSKVVRRCIPGIPREIILDDRCAITGDAPKTPLV